jgi:hypothetical protein
MGSTTIVEFAPRTRTSRTGERPENANTGECLGYGREVRQGGCQRNRAVESLRLKEWLPAKRAFQLSLRLKDCEARSLSLGGGQHARDGRQCSAVAELTFISSMAMKRAIWCCSLAARVAIRTAAPRRTKHRRMGRSPLDSKVRSSA